MTAFSRISSLMYFCVAPKKLEPLRPNTGYAPSLTDTVHATASITQGEYSHGNQYSYMYICRLLRCSLPSGARATGTGLETNTGKLPLTHIHTLATKPHCTLYDGAIASLGLTSCKDLQVNSWAKCKIVHVHAQVARSIQDSDQKLLPLQKVNSSPGRW